MKTIHLNIIFGALVLAAFINDCYAADDNEPDVSMKQISEFRKSKDDALLSQQLRALKKGGRPHAETAEMMCKILIEADEYLSTHEAPKGAPERNIAPPGGCRSGVDPSSTGDPAERAAYQKLIDENKRLAEAHRKHSSVTRIRESALNLLSNYRVNGLISEAQLDAIINNHGTSEDQKAFLRQLVKTATANRVPVTDR